MNHRHWVILIVILVIFSCAVQVFLPYLSILRKNLSDNPSDIQFRFHQNFTLEETIDDSLPVALLLMEEISEEPIPMAQILTRGTLAALTKLDAGDMVECYALTRLAKLKSIFGSVGNNTPSNMSIVKSLLAFRYLPPSHAMGKEPFELTLEYGPQRTGLLMNHEAMPILNDIEGEEKFVSWENEGKVYYNQEIVSTGYITAHYIAPTTGAVLSKILSLAVEYPSIYPRYQPFEVSNMGKLVIRSSNSDDFVWHMFDYLARMNVDIQPVLVPQRMKLRLYVDDVQKATGIEAGMEAAEFLEGLYGCTNQIQRGTFGVEGEKRERKEIEEREREETEERQRKETEFKEDEDEENEGRQEKELVGNKALFILNSTQPNEDSNSNNNTTGGFLDTNLITDDAYHDENSENDTSSSPTTPSPSTPLPSTHPTIYTPPPSTHPTIYTSSFPTPIPIDNIATSALLSGDGSQMISTLTPCLTNRTHAYLFVDGSMYFKLNMTPPYWEALIISQELPRPVPSSSGNGGFIDWMLALGIISGLLFGIAVLLNRIGVVKNEKVEFWKKKGFPLKDLQVGRGMPHPFGEDAIPFSMGGKRHDSNHQTTCPPNQRKPSNTIELIETPMAPEVFNKSTSFDQTASDRPALQSPYPLASASRDPDLVEMPNLMFSSKVAVPVTVRSASGGIPQHNKREGWEEGKMV